MTRRISGRFGRLEYDSALPNLKTSCSEVESVAAPPPEGTEPREKYSN